MVPKTHPRFFRGEAGEERRGIPAGPGDRGVVAGAASRVSDTVKSTGDSIGSAVSSAVDSAKSTSHSAAESVRSAGRSTRQSASSAYRRGRSGGRDLARGTSRAGRRAGHDLRHASLRSGDQLSQAYEETSQRLQQAHRETPLAVGLGILALGALAGSLIPRTRREDEWMGEYSDEAITQAKDAGRRAQQDATERVRSVAETAKHSAEANDLTASSLAERTTNVVEKAADSISDASREEGLHPQQLKQDVEQVASETRQASKSEAEDAKVTAKQKAAKFDSDVENTKAV